MSDINTNELLNNIDIVDLFEYCGIELKLIGKEYHGKCPFHEGKSKTVLSVNREKKVWYCFKCKTGGNMIKFFMQYKKCDFYKAFDYLGLFYREAKLYKTTLEIYQYALKITNNVNLKAA